MNISSIVSFIPFDALEQKDKKTNYAKLRIYVCFLARDFGISKLHAPCDVNQTIDTANTKYLITFVALVETLYDSSILIIGY